jgi:hypothetical protein
MFPRLGSGMGRDRPLQALVGMGMGKFLPHGDRDGKAKPDGEFPIAIFNINRGGQHKTPASVNCGGHPMPPASVKRPLYIPRPQPQIG